MGNPLKNSRDKLFGLPNSFLWVTHKKLFGLLWLAGHLNIFSAALKSLSKNLRQLVELHLLKCR
jgi:hypothetical protein